MLLGNAQNKTIHFALNRTLPTLKAIMKFVLKFPPKCTRKFITLGELQFFKYNYYDLALSKTHTKLRHENKSWKICGKLLPWKQFFHAFAQFYKSPQDDKNVRNYRNTEESHAFMLVQKIMDRCLQIPSGSEPTFQLLHPHLKFSNDAEMVQKTLL